MGKNVEGRQKVKQFLLFTGMQSNMLSWSSGDFKYQRDCWQLGFAYAALFWNAHMVCDCSVPGTDSAICSLLY